MPTREQLQVMHLQRDQLLSVNREIPKTRPSSVPTMVDASLRQDVLAIGDRAHRELGCYAASGWCPFFQLSSIA